MRQVFEVIVTSALLTEEEHGLEGEELGKAVKRALNKRLGELRANGLAAQSMVMDQNGNFVLLMSDLVR